jgi:hypothetical protein
VKLKDDIGKRRVLTISDLHAPYQHPDALDFLEHLKKQIKPDLVIQMGDLMDFHGISFHDSEPDLYSPGHELRMGQQFAQSLEDIFPDMYILGSNHGDLPLRRAKAHGLPTALFRPYNDIYGVGEDWKFVDDLLVESKDSKVYFAHGIIKDGLKLAKERGVCVVQGHFHTELNIKYASTPYNLIWSMQTGCLINHRSKAFKYNQLDLTRPIIGCGSIIKGQPHLHPMILGKDGRWVGP